MKLNSMKPIVLSALVILFSGILLWNAYGRTFQEGIDGPTVPTEPLAAKDAVGKKIKEVCDYAFQTVQTNKENDLLKQLDQLKLDLKKAQDTNDVLVKAQKT
jgi:hypothetical protein